LVALVAPASGTLTQLVLEYTGQEQLGILGFPSPFPVLTYLYLEAPHITSPFGPLLVAPLLTSVFIWLDTAAVPTPPPSIRCLNLRLRQKRFRRWLNNRGLDELVKLPELKELDLDDGTPQDEEDEDDPLNKQEKENLRRIVALAEERDVTLSGNLSPSTILATLENGVTTLKAVVEKDKEMDDSDSEYKPSGGNSDGTGDSDDFETDSEYESPSESEWDLEDSPMFRRNWSERKRRIYNFGAFSFPPVCFFASLKSN
jgi:hypothetical protein